MARAAQGSGSIRKKTVNRNGKSYTFWEGRVTVGRDPGTGKQIQKSFSGKTQREVLQKMQAAAVQVMDETYIEPSKLTVREWLDIWYAEYLGDVKPLTKVAYKRKIDNHICPSLGATKLKALSAPQIQRFYNDLSERVNLSPKSVKLVHGVLHRALQQAVTIGYIPYNPADACKLPRVQRKEINPLDDDQITAFLAAIKGHKYEVLYTVTLFTGMREGEILGLCWDRVNFKNGVITIDKQLQKEQKRGGRYIFASLKNDKSRVVQPAPFVMQLLKRHKVQQYKQRCESGQLWKETGLVFTDELGQHLCATTVYNNFKRIAAGLGLPEMRFHDLRHSYAVASIRAGDDIKTVQSNLGHATAAFTLDVYGHVTNQMRQASAERMEGYIKEVLNL